MSSGGFPCGGERPTSKGLWALSILAVTGLNGDMATKRILVTYGGKSGATAEIAEMIGAALRADGTDADVRAARAVRTVDGYDGVVLGAALYANRWHRAARGFARRHRAVLHGRPVWLFSSGPLDASADERDIPPVPTAARAMRVLGAVRHVTFGGRLDEHARGLVARAMVRGGHAGDFRNRDRIAAFAHEISAELSAHARPDGDPARGGRGNQQSGGGR